MLEADCCSCMTRYAAVAATGRLSARLHSGLVQNPGEQSLVAMVAAPVVDGRHGTGLTSRAAPEWETMLPEVLASLNDTRQL